ncbi:MAG: FxsA family protein [Myxococcota bacterium]
MGCAVLFLLFTVVPFVELSLLLRLAEALGPAETLLLVVLTGAVGAALARQEGFRVLGEWRGALERGEVPAEGVLGGLLVLVGGVLLVTPGVITDGVGLLLMLPPVRRVVADLLRRRIEAGVAAGSIRVTTFGGAPGRGAPRGVVDVEGGDVVPPRRRDESEGASAPREIAPPAHETPEKPPPMA